MLMPTVAPLDYRTVVTPRTLDVGAALVYQLWYRLREESHEALAALEALVLRAGRLGSLGAAYAELEGRVAPRRGETWWATLLGRIAQRFPECSVATDAGEAQLVERLFRAWIHAATQPVPAWASPVATMPDLSRIPAHLPLAPEYHRLSPAAQSLLLHIFAAADDANHDADAIASTCAQAIKVGTGGKCALIAELGRWAH